MTTADRNRYSWHQRRTTVHLLRYLDDFIADRALALTDLHRAQVDRIYRTDRSRIGRWTAHWNASAQLPYLYRNGRYLFTLHASFEHIATIRSQHHVH